MSAGDRGAARAGGGGGPTPAGGRADPGGIRPPSPQDTEDGGQPPTRAGFVALAGRPNVGKSTLLNRVVGTKVAIVSPKPQTTRRAIRGVAAGPDWQLVLVDLPGSQRPRDLLTQRMQRRTERELRESDAVLLMLNGEQAVGPGDRFIAATVSAAEVSCVVAVNKVDALDRAGTAAALSAAAQLELPPDAEIYPISARTGSGVEALLEGLVAVLPEGPFLYPAGETDDLSEEVRLAELVREQVLARTRQELPHAVEVEVGEIEERPGGALVVAARLWVEAESQKGILVGAGGRTVRAIGTAARAEIEARSGRRVHLDLTVCVRRRWRGDEAMLDRLGLG
jgi:GTPase